MFSEEAWSLIGYFFGLLFVSQLILNGLNISSGNYVIVSFIEATVAYVIGVVVYSLRTDKERIPKNVWLFYLFMALSWIVIVRLSRLF
ncbi:MAG: hypothetical protein BTN85_0240 [Candidatus Methanohalarchaeum thermophilum]|uniref:Uncharacterized protein n=1 Tax=Methanohalarchaeum thermophilum TaxID=1903181 RepID=A0A1Q6DTT0_METT1|nr:MAG: hypothetical protein BTN85_0240 [Candidatus Methanohalarchaeum thermophilum]